MGRYVWQQLYQATGKGRSSEGEEKEEGAEADFYLTESSSSRARAFTDREWLMFDTVCRSQLPPAARPLFIRFIVKIDKTETFKLQKSPLKRTGYELSPSQLGKGESVYLVTKKLASSCAAPARCLVDETLLGELRAGTVQL